MTDYYSFKLIILNRKQRTKHTNTRSITCGTENTREAMLAVLFLSGFAINPHNYYKVDDIEP